jgi:hypothetical protein
MELVTLAERFRATLSRRKDGSIEGEVATNYPLPQCIKILKCMAFIHTHTHTHTTTG